MFYEKTLRLVSLTTNLYSKEQQMSYGKLEDTDIWGEDATDPNNSCKELANEKSTKKKRFGIKVVLPKLNKQTGEVENIPLPDILYINEEYFSKSFGKGSHAKFQERRNNMKRKLLKQAELLENHSEVVLANLQVVLFRNEEGLDTSDASDNDYEEDDYDFGI